MLIVTVYYATVIRTVVSRYSSTLGNGQPGDWFSLFVILPLFLLPAGIGREDEHCG